GGYVFGWDSGFEDNGDAFLGGLSVGLSDDLTVTYATVGGRFADDRITTEQGYMHSIVADLALTDNLQYIFQSDLLDTEDNAGALVRETFGINQYLIYTVSDCVAFGGRFEWYNQEGVFLNDNGTPGNDADDFAQESDIYALTLGMNYRPHANVIVRPEIRWDWDDDLLAGLDEGDDQTTFGFDTIFMF
ncbi:outer membrane beta-barrel protein, partial [Roseiconus lacunae]|uniref:outer membrane beta-barrel protein n=1 Tax=Roseiconus lacunae TaxID=2605694 RepID=UPI001E4D405E